MEILSVVIVSFNADQVLKKSLLSLKENFRKYPINYEVIVVDNGSEEKTVDLLRQFANSWRELKPVFLRDNLGFSKACNVGLRKARGVYLLFLNPDVIVSEIDFCDLIFLLNRYPQIGALTVKVILPSGQLDPACHRGFPTPWRSFCYFTGLEKIFSSFPLLNRIFGGYHMTYLNKEEIHEIDSLTGAFLFSRKSIIEKVGGFCEDYFAYGEDIDLCWQMKKLGYQIVFYPLWSVIHFKSVSGLKEDDPRIKKQTVWHFYEAMKIFYRRHYACQYPWLFNQLVYLLIDIKKKLALYGSVANRH